MEKYRNRGGIRSIFKAWEQAHQKASLEDENEKIVEPPPLLIVPPGRALFTKPPSLVDAQEIIREVISGRWLEHCYKAQPWHVVSTLNSSVDRHLDYIHSLLKCYRYTMIVMYKIMSSCDITHSYG